MFIDTHCHLDASEFDADRDEVISRSLAVGVSHIIVPAVSIHNFDLVIALHQQYPQCSYALGIHPMYVNTSSTKDISVLSNYLRTQQAIAIGEIGLDYFVKKDNIERQQYFFTEQLQLAQQFKLPVILHVRHAIDDVLKYLRRYPVQGGIAHAFNGSLQQAEQFIKLGFKLGFGGAMTYTRALKIRALAKELPIESLVLETDAPDIPPAWLIKNKRNTPYELPEIAQVLANIKELPFQELATLTKLSTLNTFPSLVLKS